MKSVLLKMSAEHWEKVVKRQKTLVVKKTRPVGTPFPVRVIVYAGEPVKAVVGEFLAGHFLRRSTVGGLAARSAEQLQSLIEYAAGEEVYAWTIDDPVAYEAPVPMSKAGLQRVPQADWMYIDVSEFWPYEGERTEENGDSFGKSAAEGERAGGKKTAAKQGKKETASKAGDKVQKPKGAKDADKR